MLKGPEHISRECIGFRLSAIGFEGGRVSVHVEGRFFMEEKMSHFMKK